jgi:hypothetical protein
VLKDFYEYDHPSLYLHLVEGKAANRAWRIISHKPKDRRLSKKIGNKRARRAVKQYLKSGSKPRIRNRIIGNSYDIA